MTRNLSIKILIPAALVLAGLGVALAASADTITVSDEVIERSSRAGTATLIRPAFTRIEDETGTSSTDSTTTAEDGVGSTSGVGELDIPAEDGSEIFTDGELPDENGADDMEDELTPPDPGADLPSEDGGNGTPSTTGEPASTEGASISSTILADMDLLTTLLEIYHRVSTR